MRYESGSFYNQAKIVRTSIPTALWLMTYDFLSLKYDVNVVSKSKKQKKRILVVFLKVTDELPGSGSVGRGTDPRIRIRTKMSRSATLHSPMLEKSSDPWSEIFYIPHARKVFRSLEREPLYIPPRRKSLAPGARSMRIRIRHTAWTFLSQSITLIIRPTGNYSFEV
jgi:hypothetical protein